MSYTTRLAQNYLGVTPLQRACASNSFKLVKHSKISFLMTCYYMFLITKIINEPLNQVLIFYLSSILAIA